jgi:hypothetical protein
VPTPRVWCRRRTDGESGCAGIGAPLLSQVESAVYAELATSLADWRADPGRLARRRGDLILAAADVRKIEASLAATRTAMGRITREWALERLPEVAYRESTADLAKAEAELEEQVKIEHSRGLAAVALDFVSIGREVVDLWPDLLGPERNRLLRPLVVAIVIR